jgi:hypothetical protein
LELRMTLVRDLMLTMPDFSVTKSNSAAPKKKFSNVLDGVVADLHNSPPVR